MELIETTATEETVTYVIALGISNPNYTRWMNYAAKNRIKYDTTYKIGQWFTEDAAHAKKAEALGLLVTEVTEV